MKTILFYILVFLGYHSASVAQNEPDSIILRGFVIDGESLGDLHGVHVYTSERHGTITDGKGFFRIETRERDTLTFSRIGYETKKIIVKSTLQKSGMVVSLKPRVYLLDTVDIMMDHYSDSWMIKPERKPVHIEGISRYIDPSYNKHETGALQSLQSPVDAIYRMFSKKYKEEKEVYYLKKEQEKQNSLKNDAFGRLDEIMKAADRQLSDEQYEALIEYCRIDLQWIVNANDYDLYLGIKDCLDRFVQNLSKED